MAADKYDLLGPAFADVGREAVRLAGGEADGIFLYVEIGDGWVRPSLFKDEGDSVHYVDLDASTPLFDLLTHAWCLEPVGKRWTSMHYTVDHGKFASEMDYDDLEGSEEAIEDRRERILRARYGDKPVTYSPMPSDSWTLKPSS